MNEMLTEKANDFKKYMENRLAPMIRNHVNLPTKLKMMDKDWSNNMAESMNNILKIGTNHKAEEMSDLIDIKHRLVKSMYQDMDKAFVSLGNFRLKPSFEHYMISFDVWCNKEEPERKKILQRFYRDTGRNNKCVTSANGQLTVPQTPGGGKSHIKKENGCGESYTAKVTE